MKLDIHFLFLILSLVCMNLPLLNLLLIVSLLTFHQLFYFNQSSSEQSLPENGGTVCQVQAFLAVAHDEASDLQVL